MFLFITTTHKFPRLVLQYKWTPLSLLQATFNGIFEENANFIVAGSNRDSFFLVAAIGLLKNVHK